MIYFLGSSHLHPEYLQPVQQEINSQSLFRHCEIEGFRGMPIWSQTIKDKLEQHHASGQKLVWMVIDFKANNEDAERIADLQASDSLFLDSAGYPGNVDKRFLENTHIETLGNHSIRVIDDHIKNYPSIKLIFWCLYMRSRANSSSYPRHLWYDQLVERYKNHVLDLDLFTNPQEFTNLVIDSGGHPNAAGFKLLDQMIKSAFA
jgi:hypothetical protein